VLNRVWDRAKAFLTEAGTLIFCVTILIWAAGYFPGDRAEHHRLEAQVEDLTGQVEEATEALETIKEDLTLQAQRDQLAAQIEQLNMQIEGLVEQEHQLSATLIQQSFLGQAGKWIEPAVKPLGWDWRIGVGAIASFPAREVIIATLGTIFSLGGDVDEESDGLMSTLQSATWPDGAPLFTLPVALSVMVFFALCAQCGATLMVMKRETNGWTWPVFTFVYMTTLAYVGAFIVYQVGTAIGG